MGTGWSVGRAAAALGVSVRTLHHWEALGLVTATRAPSGYRSYDEPTLARLRRVVRYRDLGVSLADISALLDDGVPGTVDRLRDRRTELREQLKRTRETLAAVERLLETLETGLRLSPEEQREYFGSDWDPRWTVQAHDRWGRTDAWQQYAERSADRSAADWERLADDVRALEQDLRAALLADVRPGGTRANTLAERHRTALTAHFSCSYTRQVCVARHAAEDPELRAHYDRLAPGLADWLRAAVEENARAHGVDPATASWDTASAWDTASRE